MKFVNAKREFNDEPCILNKKYIRFIVKNRQSKDADDAWIACAENGLSYYLSEDAVSCIAEDALNQINNERDDNWE